MASQLSLDSAIEAVNDCGALLVFPIKGKAQPQSLWSYFYPRREMNWDWSSGADPAIARLWHLREELSRSNEVVYAKWFQGRATVFSFDVFTALLSYFAPHEASTALSHEARVIYDLLLDDSPLPTKRLRELASDSAALTTSVFDRALRELWSRLFIVGYGEVDEGSYPSLATGATKLLFEDLWNTATGMSDAERESTIGRRLEETFQRQCYRNATRLGKKLRESGDNHSPDKDA